MKHHEQGTEMKMETLEKPLSTLCKLTTLQLQDFNHSETREEKIGTKFKSFGLLKCATAKTASTYAQSALYQNFFVCVFLHSSNIYEHKKPLSPSSLILNFISLSLCPPILSLSLTQTLTLSL